MAKATSTAKAEQSPYDLIECEVWKVKAEFKYKVNEDNGQSERYMSGVTKTGTAPIKTTIIERKQQAELNSHVENSNLYYYEK